MKILVIGGAGSGKETFAQSVAARMTEPRYWISTERGPGGFTKSSGRFERAERAERANRGFATIERNSGLGEASVAYGATTVVENADAFLRREMFVENAGSDVAAARRVLDGASLLAAKCSNTLIVTDEVGAGGDGERSRAFVEALGFLNRELSKRADAVYEVVAGIPVCVKDGGLKLDL